jgi:hypothetical protein
MKPRSRLRHKGRSESGGTFTAIPHAVQDCANWRQCSATAIKMLCDVARQYNGRNNGDLCAALSVLRPYGWTAPETVLGFARATALRLPAADSARRIARAELVRRDVEADRRVRRQADLCEAVTRCAGRLETAARTVQAAEQKTKRQYAIRSRPLRHP